MPANELGEGRLIPARKTIQQGAIRNVHAGLHFQQPSNMLADAIIRCDSHDLVARVIQCLALLVDQRRRVGIKNFSSIAPRVVVQRFCAHRRSLNRAESYAQGSSHIRNPAARLSHLAAAFPITK
jgi:hypothetical protein